MAKDTKRDEGKKVERPKAKDENQILVEKRKGENKLKREKAEEKEDHDATT